MLLKTFTYTCMQYEYVCLLTVFALYVIICTPFSFSGNCRYLINAQKNILFNDIKQ